MARVFKMSVATGVVFDCETLRQPGRVRNRFTLDYVSQQRDLKQWY